MISAPMMISCIDGCSHNIMRMHIGYIYNDTHRPCFICIIFSSRNKNHALLCWTNIHLSVACVCTLYMYMYVKVHAIHYWVVFHYHNYYDLPLKHAINSCPIVLFPCRMIVLMGVVTIFNSMFVASDFAVMVVSTENYKYMYLCPKYFNR